MLFAKTLARPKPKRSTLRSSQDQDPEVDLEVDMSLMDTALMLQALVRPTNSILLRLDLQHVPVHVASEVTV